MQAVGLLRDLGYTNVRHYPGGLAEWFNGGGAPEVHHENVRLVRAPRPIARTTPAQAFHPSTLSTRFIDALGEQPVGALFRWWLAIVIGCGGAFWLAAFSGWPLLSSGGHPISLEGVHGLVTAIYFSAVTATSIGYGDIVPSGAARLLAIAAAAGHAGA